MFHETTAHGAPSLPAAARDTVAALDPCLVRLLAAAQGRAGLSVLLLLGQDPMTCDTAHGFARRLHQPLAEVCEALASLSASGVLRTFRHPGGPDAVSYWLSEDSSLFAALRRLIETYAAGPSERRILLRALPPCPVAA